MLRPALLAGLAALTLALPPISSSYVLIDGTTDQLPDFDSREAVQPSAEQLAAAEALGAKVEWSRFGTPMW